MIRLHRQTDGRMDGQADRHVGDGGRDNSRWRCTQIMLPGWTDPCAGVIAAQGSIGIVMLSTSDEM